MLLIILSGLKATRERRAMALCSDVIARRSLFGSTDTVRTTACRALPFCAAPATLNELTRIEWILRHISSIPIVQC